MLKPDQLRHRCNPDKLPFTTTNDVPELKGTVGHDRAISAINFGLSNKMKGFNLYLLGDSGSGKTSILKKLLEKRARSEPTPPDWVYVYNFDDSNQPVAYSMPHGMGAQFQKDMAGLVAELKRLIPKLQEGEKYLQTGQAITEQYRKKEDRAFASLHTKGLKHDLNIEQVSGELLIQVVKNGQPLDHEEFEQLTNNERKYYEEKVRDLQDDISEYLRVQRKLDREKQEKIKTLEEQQILNHTEDLISELKKKYQGVPGLKDWLSELWKNVPQAVMDYQRQQEESEQVPEGPIPYHFMDFHQFRVNLFVNNKDCVGAPVVFENTPTLHNLIGCVEYQEQYGMLHTDYTLVRAGSLHRANGGYLVIQVNDLLKSLYAWEALKKALRNKEVLIEELDIEQRAKTTVSPKPKGIPLQTKVVLIGSYEAYYFLHGYDEDFERLFKVKAEFDDSLPLTMSNIKKYCGFIRRLVREDNLLPFHKTAVSKIIEYSSRVAEHQKKISARFLHLINLVSEANYWAAMEGAELVDGGHVMRALKERHYRTGKLEFEMYEQIREGTVLIDTKRNRVGQINGIALFDIGDHSFGIPSRITAQTYVGRQGVMHIDREVHLSGRIHSKASLILVGILGGLYARKKPISMSASITFEQMYGGIEGDSATIAELLVLISSLSEIPINQGICVTGSLNQHGEVQPIGGVNEKIEGVYQICKTKGLDGKQGVIIPAQNVVNLMLDEEIVEAVEQGKFHIWAVRNINQAIEVVLGRPAREVHAKAHKRLDVFRAALEEANE
jgi:lon-related putative ATP-dependent protease